MQESETASTRPAHRVAWIDHLRVLSCWAVILIHVSGEAYSRFTAPPSLEWWLANLMNGSCRACVPVFAMISGALIKEGDCNAVSFYRNKSRRLLPVLLAWTALYAVFDQIVLGQTTRQVVLGFISKGYVYPHLWYLSMFVCILAVTPFIARLKFSIPCQRRDWRLLGGLGVLFVAIDGSARSISRGAGMEFNQWPWIFLLFVPYVLLGACLAGPTPRSDRSRYGMLLALALAASWLANFLTCRYLRIVADSTPLSNHSPMVMAVAAAGFLWVRSNPAATWKSSPRLATLGDATLGVYLLHPFIIWLILRLLRGTNIDALGGWWMPITAAVAFTTSFAAILLVRRLPFGRRLC